MLPPAATATYAWYLRDGTADARLLQVALARRRPVDEEWSAPFALDRSTSFLRRAIPPPETLPSASEGPAPSSSATVRATAAAVPSVQLTVEIQPAPAPGIGVAVLISSWFAVTNRTTRPLTFAFAETAASATAGPAMDVSLRRSRWTVGPGATVALPTPAPDTGRLFSVAHLPVPNRFSLRWSDDGAADLGTHPALHLLDPATSAPQRHAVDLPGAALTVDVRKSRSRLVVLVSPPAVLVNDTPFPVVVTAATDISDPRSHVSVGPNERRALHWPSTALAGLRLGCVSSAGAVAWSDPLPAPGPGAAASAAGALQQPPPSLAPSLAGATSVASLPSAT